jgi:hypothetical protein
MIGTIGLIFIESSENIGYAIKNVGYPDFTAHEFG